MKLVYYRVTPALTLVERNSFDRSILRNNMATKTRLELLTDRLRLNLTIGMKPRCTYQLCGWSLSLMFFLFYFLLASNPSSPGLDGSFQFTRGASGLISILDMFGFENSQVRHWVMVKVLTCK